MCCELKTRKQEMVKAENQNSKTLRNVDQASIDPLHRRDFAFSLVEIMVVLVIIGLLAGVVTLSVQNYMVTGRQNTARMEVARLTEAIDTYMTVYGKYPSNDEGLSVLAQQGEKLPEPLIPRVPKDPWGGEYQYNQPGRDASFEVICYGADGTEGGAGADADIASYNLQDSR